MKWVVAIVLVLLLGYCAPPAVLLIAMAPAMRPSSTAPEQVEGIPPVLLEAYAKGAEALAGRHPGCTNLTWAVLAGIGRIESTHGAGHTIAANGDTRPPFIGPRLDGSGVGGNLTPHYDTDNGKWDNDTAYDRAVGLTQHLPANWARYGADGNNDGHADPHNAFDSVLSTAVELCTSAPGKRVDFSDRGALNAALYRYNPSRTYVNDVLQWVDTYTAMSRPDGRPPRRGGSGSGNDIIEAAEEWLGTPYLYGGQCNTLGKDRCDCSSLARYAYRHGAGIELPRVTQDQVQLPRTDPDRFEFIPPESAGDLQEGDMLFFGHSPPQGITHVGLYISDTEMIEAPRTGLNVITREWKHRTNFHGAVRFVGPG